MCNIKMLYCMCVRCFLVKPRPQAPIKHERYYKVHKSLPINNVLQLSFFFASYCYLWFIYYCTCPVHIFIFLYYFINSMYLLHIILYLFFYLFCNHWVLSISFITFVVLIIEYFIIILFFCFLFFFNLSEFSLQYFLLLHLFVLHKDIYYFYGFTCISLFICFILFFHFVSLFIFRFILVYSILCFNYLFFDSYTYMNKKPVCVCVA